MGATALPTGSSLKILRGGGLYQFVADRAESFTPVYGSLDFCTGHRFFFCGQGERLTHWPVESLYVQFLRGRTILLHV